MPKMKTSVVRAICLMLIAVPGALAQSTRNLPAEFTNLELSEKQQEQFRLGTRKYKADVTFILQGRRYDDPIVNSRFSRLFIDLELEGKYESWFYAQLGLVQMLTSGQASNLLSDKEGGTGDGLILDQASLNIVPQSWITASVGVIKAPLNPTYSQFFPQSNAGGALKLEAKGDSAQITLTGSQSTPTASGTSNRVSDQDTLPLMTVGAAELEMPFDTVGFKAIASAAHFTFTDLPSLAASDSHQTGSTTIGNSKAGYQFAYEFRGMEYAVVLKQKLLSADEISLKGSALRNELAPRGASSGWQGRLQYTKTFNRWTITPSFTRFHLESDAIPSTYGPLVEGFTNRDGYSIGTKLEFPKEKFNVFAGYVRTNVLNPNTTSAVFQADRDVYTLSAEATYDIF